jgi:hypothetical protein
MEKNLLRGAKSKSANETYGIEMAIIGAIFGGVGGLLGATTYKFVSEKFSNQYAEAILICIGMVLFMMMGRAIGLVSLLDLLLVGFAVAVATVSFMMARHKADSVPLVGGTIVKMYFNAFVETLWLVGVPVLLIWLIPL